jgi:hypothetical protein
MTGGGRRKERKKTEREMETNKQALSAWAVL